MTARAGLRLAGGVVLGLLLGSDLLVGGFGALGGVRLYLFPYLFLFLLADSLIERHRFNDAQVYLLGAGFSFLYLGVYTKEMQTGFALSGIDWVAALGGPLEWGMRLVLWFHCLAVVFPREEKPLSSHWASWTLVGLIGAAAAFACLFKSYFGYYQAERVLGALWPLTDLLFAGLAWVLWKRLTLKEARKNPLWVWGVAGLGIWLSGSSLLARMSEGFELIPPLFYMVQLGWTAGLALFGFTSWRDRAAFDDTPLPRSKAVLAAAALRVLGVLVLLKLFGPAEENPRAGFWAGALCDLPSKLLFYYAFLTSRLEV